MGLFKFYKPSTYSGLFGRSGSSPREGYYAQRYAYNPTTLPARSRDYSAQGYVTQMRERARAQAAAGSLGRISGIGGAQRTWAGRTATYGNIGAMITNRMGIERSMGNRLLDTQMTQEQLLAARKGRRSWV